MSSEPSAILALSLLLLIAAGLVFSALYVIFGQPTTHVGKKRKKQMMNGFQLGGGIVLGIVLFGTLEASIAVAFFGAETRSSKPLVLALGAVSVALIALTVQRWGKYLGGWVGYSIFPALLAANSGHYHGQAIPRSVALTYVAVAALTVVASFRFTEDYALNAVEKTALVVCVLAFAVSVNVKRYEMPILFVGSVGLALAWLYTYIASRFGGVARALAMGGDKSAQHTSRE